MGSSMHPRASLIITDCYVFDDIYSRVETSQETRVLWGNCQLNSPFLFAISVKV